MAKITLDIENLHADKLNTCKWCGSELPIEHRCGKPRKYCSDDCKKNYVRFNRSFLKLLEAWKEYTGYIKSGNLDEANKFKNKSVYGHLFDDKLNYAEWLHKVRKSSYVRFNRSFLKLLEAWKEYTGYIKSGNLDEANKFKNKSVYGHLFDDKLNCAEWSYKAGESGCDTFIWSVLKLLEAWKEYTEYIKSGNLDKANELKNKSVYGHLFDDKLNDPEWLYKAGWCGITLRMYIRQPCQNCGGEISVSRDIRARFCSDKCRDEYNNKRKKEN